jgi:predicted Fe-Mo cluster-binding NifX family protein
MPPTRLAIATADGTSVYGHLARCASVVVFEIDNGVIVSRSVCSRASDTCWQHRSFVDLMAGCQAVICGGIGRGAADALAANGIEPLVLTGPTSIEEAAAGYLAGTLVTTDERVCLCG